MEELKFNCQNELRQHHIDFEGLKHNYDRKELVLQNLESKINKYEKYIFKQSSMKGCKEAEQLIHKFQHEKFSGGMDSKEEYGLLMHESRKITNIVEENKGLKA